MMYTKRYIFSIVAITLIFTLLLFKDLGFNDFAEEIAGKKNCLISMDKSKIKPDDGDSFFYNDIAIRVLGIDTPEIIHKDHGIFEDQPYGREAATMTANILAGAETIFYIPLKNDKYGRLLSHIFVDGELLSVLLIKEGLAYETISYYGDNGFPDLAEMILKAARNSKQPKFEKPYKWRRKHQAVQ
ncbi:MAG: thermonuclease family protein [Deltaproteobacteria bacterium]|nr:thermonuclease family protein [Deltaproteobacteria bacterium]